MGTAAIILAQLPALLQIAQTGMSIVDRINKGELTEEQAKVEWEKTRAEVTSAWAGWEAAGR